MGGVLQEAGSQEGEASSILSASLLPTANNLETKSTTQKGKNRTRGVGRHSGSSQGWREVRF